MGDPPPDARPDPRAADADLLRQVTDGAPLVMGVVDAAGNVRWVSEASERLFGYRPDEVIGTNILDHMDVDWNLLALDSIGAAMVGRGLQRPMLFRARRKDGSYFVAEVTANSQMDDPVIDGLAVYIRRWDERYLVDGVVDSLAAGAPLDATLQLLVEIMGAETLEADGVVMLEPDAERFLRSVAASGLSGQQTNDGGEHDTPWAVARSSGQPQAVRVADLPARFRTAVTDHRWCWVWPVIGPDRVDACLVLWRRADEDVDHTCRFLMEKLVRLTSLVLERERAAAALRHAATHDPLTGLANRTSFFDTLGRALADRRGPLVGVLYIDLDGFKPVNDRLGHGAGDHVLREVARRLHTVVRDGDLVSRLGGDEFTVLCREVGHVDELQGIAERLTVAVAEPVVIGGERSPSAPAWASPPHRRAPARSTCSSMPPTPRSTRSRRPTRAASASPTRRPADPAGRPLTGGPPAHPSARLTRASRGRTRSATPRPARRRRRARAG